MDDPATANVPATQGVQVEEPETEEKEPAKQLIQAGDASGAYWPDMQMTGTETAEPVHA